MDYLNSQLFSNILRFGAWFHTINWHSKGFKIALFHVVLSNMTVIKSGDFWYVPKIKCPKGMGVTLKLAVSYIYCVFSLYYIFAERIRAFTLHANVATFVLCISIFNLGSCYVGGGPRVVVGTTAFHARVRGSLPNLGGLKETKCFSPIHS